jgi:uncharacterized protein (TIGR00369 family)
MPKLTTEAADKILNDMFAPWVLALDIHAAETGDQSVLLRIPFNDRLCRVGGIICGQALASGADTAMVLAIAAASGGFKPCTTVDQTINYMRPITAGDALLEAKVMRLGKTLAFCTTEVRDTAGKVAAFSTGTYALLP